MKMKKQVLLWLAPVLMLAAFFAGCDSGDEGGGADYGITPTPRKPKNPSAPEAANYGVTVSPGAVKLRKGILQQFTAARTDGGGEGTFDWTVEGGSAEGGTAIDEDGVLTVGAGETAKELTVKAALKGDSGKYGTATALILSTEDQGLSVTPQLVLLGRGESETFTAEIIGDDGEESPAIAWSVDDSAGSAGSGETFTYTVGDEEAEETLTVKASVSAEVYGAALITVLGGEEEGVAPIPVNYGIRVAPQSAIVVKGASMTFGAYEWDGSGETVASGLEWDVFGGGEGTGINDGGVLTVAALETAEYLTVRAKNLSRAGTAVVKVRAAGDIDGDGIPDAQDDDIDGDGIPNGKDPDVDGDGIPNNEDDDIDGDGIPNEQDPDVDGPGGPDVISVTLDSVSADGSPTSATTVLTLTFSQDITGLNKDHLTLGGSTGAQRETLSKASGTGKYELTVSGITADGQVTVSIGSQPSGYNITGSPSTNVYKGETTVTMTVTPNGNSTTTTTELTLGFTPGIANLALGEITISNTGNTGATKGTTLSGATTSYTLTLSGITAGGSITVSVSKSGYRVAPQDVTVYYVSSGYTDPGTGANGGKSLKQEFNVTSTGTQAVTDTFTAVSNFIKNGGLTSGQTRIALGDYIDLEGGLTVAAYGTGNYTGAFSISAAEGSKAIPGLTSTTYNAGYKGCVLRLIVVGINSFRSNGTYTAPAANNKDHVVFQFQNIPVQRRMNSSDTNTGGYAASEMRSYLTINFLPGLTSAGVPGGVLWAPTRYISKGYTDANRDTADIITDKLWLPTEREMFNTRYGSNSSIETTSNQPFFNYYTSGDVADAKRMKYLSTGPSISSSGWGDWYWEASTYSYGSSYFCTVGSGGEAIAGGLASSGGGCAPAFCVAY